MATIYDVAKQAGVSTATVSRSFSKTNRMSAETRQRVLEVAELLNYRPRRAQLAVETPSAERQVVLTDPIGFQFFAHAESETAQTNAFYAPLLHGAQAETEASGRHLLLFTMHRHHFSGELPRMVCKKQLAGILLVGTADPEILTAFYAHIPYIILVDNWDVTGQHDSIVSNGFEGAFAATRYLFELGHRQIGFAMSEPQTLTFRDRLHGYLAAHFECHAPVDPRLVIQADPMDTFAPQVQALLSSPQRPTALMTANDMQAYTVMQIARDMGLEIPGDLSLVGFDNERYSALAYPPLTTVNVDTETMGRLAIRRLLHRLKEAEQGVPPERPIQITVPVSLVVRDSCCPLRG